MASEDGKEFLKVRGGLTAKFLPRQSRFHGGLRRVTYSQARSCE